MADSASSGKVISNNETSSPNNSPHLAFTTISNIKLHILVQLSLSEPNYKKWSRLFRLLILRFNLKGYIDGTTIASSADDAEWYQFDALIQGWILSTITDEVSDLVLANNLSAHARWTAIYNLFHNNKHAREMQLEHYFRTTVKGQLSINDYCHLLKNLSEYLDDVDAPITEHALVLQVLQGLPHDIRKQAECIRTRREDERLLSGKRCVGFEEDGKRAVADRLMTLMSKMTCVGVVSDLFREGTQGMRISNPNSVQIRFGYHISTEITRTNVLTAHSFSSISSSGCHDQFGVENLLLHVDRNLLHAWEAPGRDRNALHQRIFFVLPLNRSK
ncbi:unnamed protein product [Cuscuta campestris]|uniref:Retrotransposon Copia-like N-terminal domain-containing protein n=1 Tax=Cuscuta campestris TaxID=132261 RepID=A0A484N3B4_9ASTE|nr:unnamed protein product [Cuscuta campestris]